jgi:hypothetical protein
MQMQHKNFCYWHACLTFFVLLAGLSASALDDKDRDKDRHGSAPGEQHGGKPSAPAQHSSPAARSGNSGQPTYSGRQSGHSDIGRQSGHSESHAGNPSHRTEPDANNTPRPGSTNSGRPTSSRSEGNPPGHMNSNNDSRDSRSNHNAGTAEHRPGPGTGSSSRDRSVERSAGRHTGNPEHHDAHERARYEAPRRITHEGNRTIARDNRGRVREIVRPGLSIHRDFHGERHFVAERNGRRIVGFGNGRGFTERRYYARGPRVYVQRTYVFGGRRFAVAYRSYRYRGLVYYHYAPAYYYHPVFYGWAYRPWVRPVYYRWGWFGDPWYPAYGYYFRTYPVYPSAALWLTDFLLAENLRLAYEARANANAAAEAQYADPQPVSSGEVALSPEVKQLIADEVQRQLAAERAASEQPSSAAQPAEQVENAPLPEEVPDALDPNQRVFIVASNLDLVTETGECSVTPGDVLLRTGTAPNENNRIGVNVVSSKQGDCPVNTNSEVEVSDLQEMHNHFREKMDSGLKSLADNQGKNGLPTAPDTGTSTGEVPPPTPDQSAESDLQDEQKSADNAERDIPKSGPGTE